MSGTTLKAKSLSVREWKRSVLATMIARTACYALRPNAADSLNIRVFCLLIVAVTLLLTVGGCGDDDSSAGAGGDEITVETGSLSKAQFVKRADKLCKKALSEFRREYVAFARTPSSQPRPNFEPKVVRTMLVPHYEQLIDQISSLGAPSGDEEEVADFLKSIQDRLDEVNEQPSEAFETFSPLSGSSKLARESDLDGCAESLG